MFFRISQRDKPCFCSLQLVYLDAVLRSGLKSTLNRTCNELVQLKSTQAKVKEFSHSLNLVKEQIGKISG